MKDQASDLGAGWRVRGATAHAARWPDLPPTRPIAVGRAYAVGQIGSFVRFPLGFVSADGIAGVRETVTGGTLARAQVIVIDRHGEFGGAVKGSRRVFSIGSKDHPFLLPYWCLSFDELGWFLVDRRSASETMQDGNLRDKIAAMRKATCATVKVGAKQTKLSAEEVTADAPLPFDLRELWY